MANEITLPALGENVESGEIVDIKVAVGDEVKAGQTLIEVESEKATVEVPSPEAGRIAEVRVKKGDRVATGQTLFVLEGSNGAAAPAEKKKPEEEKKARAEAPPAEKPKTEKPVAEKKPVESDGRHQADSPAQEGKLVPAGPATRRLARELGVDLARVPGSAAHGRVTQDDVKNFVKELASGRGGAAAPALQAPPMPDFAQWGPVDVKPVDSIRRKIAEQMSRAWSLIPHVTHQDLADVTELESFRKQQSNGVKITVTAFALKAAAIVLRQFADFNASLDLTSGKIIYKQYYHVGVAVDTEHGLLVPVIRDVDKKSVHELAQELAAVAEQARNKKLSADAMRGGTFTITNLGGIGGVGFSPIVNYPQVAILGMSRARMQPVWKDGQFVPRLLLPLSLSYDHRIIDGADAARFARRFAELLENPLVMLLHA